MKTITETIPTAFSPETAFAITLQEMNEKPEPENEVAMPVRFASPREYEFTRRGIPASALND